MPDPSSSGIVELSIIDDSMMYHCPFSLFDADVLVTYRQKITQVMEEWEEFKGGTSIYDEASQVQPGCLAETLAAE